MAERTDQYWDLEQAAWVTYPPERLAAVPAQPTGVEDERAVDVRSG